MMKSFWRAIGYAVLYSALNLLLQVVVMFGIMGIGAMRGLHNQYALQAYCNDNMLIVTILSGCLVAVVMLLIFKRGKKNLKAQLWFNNFNGKSLLWTGGLAFSASMIIMLSHYGDLRENVTLVSSSARYLNGLLPGLGFILLVMAINVVAPVSEEIALRGIVCTRLAQQFKPWLAIIISAVLFGFMHIFAGGIMLVLTASIMGAILGLIFFRYNSLKLSICAHAIANTPDLIFFGQPALTDTIRFILMAVLSVMFIFCLWRVLQGSELNKLYRQFSFSNNISSEIPTK